MKLIVQIVFLLYLFLIVPFLMGILDACIFKRNHKKISAILTNGYLGMMACFCILSILAVKMEWALSRLAFVWAVMVVLISVVTLLFGRKQMKNFLKEMSEFWEFRKEKGNLGKRKCLFLGMLVYFIVLSIFFTRPNAEDNTWEIVHTAVTTDTMYLYDEYSGYLSMEAMEGHAYSPVEMLYAAAISLTGSLDTLALYYVIPVCLIIFFYMGLWKFGTKFFEDTDNTMTFVGMVCVIYWMTTYLKGQSAITGIFLNSWNGLTVLSCFVMPVVLSTLLQWLEFGERDSKANIGKIEILYRIIIFLLAGQLTNEKGGFYILLMLMAGLCVRFMKQLLEKFL